MSRLPLLRNTSSSSSSQGAPNGERYLTSIVVHAAGGVTFHPPGLCACMLPGKRPLLTTNFSESVHVFFFSRLASRTRHASGCSAFAFQGHYRTFPPRRGPQWLNACAIFKLPSGTLGTYRHDEASASTTSLDVVSLTVTQLSRCSHHTHSTKLSNTLVPIILSMRA